MVTIRCYQKRNILVLIHVSVCSSKLAQTVMFIESSTDINCTIEVEILKQHKLHKPSICKSVYGQFSPPCSFFKIPEFCEKGPGSSLTVVCKNNMHQS